MSELVERLRDLDRVWDAGVVVDMRLEAAARIKELERAHLEGWKEATIAWSVCASIHREYAKGRDPFFTTRQGDFVKHENDARAVLEKKP